MEAEMYYLSSTLNTILTINLMVVFAILIFIFYRIIRKEKKSYKRRKALSINDIVRYKVLSKFLKYQINKNQDLKEFTLLLISIDQFESIGKYVNKEEESNYLRKVAANMQMYLPLHGKMAQTVSRPEFVIYLPKVYEEEQLNRIIQNFKNSAEKRVDIQDAVYIQKSISIAYTSYQKDGSDLETLLNNLKTTMLNIKRQNGNLVLGYNQGIKENYPERFDFFKKAIQNDEIDLYYYPIYDVINKEVYGTEVIVNWKNKANEVNTLRDLLFYAEASNDEYWMGLWVFEKMLEAHMNLFRILSTKEYYTFIQTSIKQFDNDNIIEVFERITKKYLIEPRRVVFQIINPIEANSSIKLMKNIIELQRIGFKFCLEVNKIDNRLKVIINEYNISFIKISKGAIIDKANIIDLQTYAKDNRIDIIVTDINNEEEAVNYINKATYLQGGLDGFPCGKDNLLTLVTKYRRSL
jgi:EAL domain-containing protein (putative c-di-GMP-specific phosphodiesterase class I)/GGDEF domain-containing protein